MHRLRLLTERVHGGASVIRGLLAFEEGEQARPSSRDRSCAFQEAMIRSTVVSHFLQKLRSSLGPCWP